MHETAQATGMDSVNLVGPVTAKLSALNPTTSNSPGSNLSSQTSNVDTSQPLEINGTMFSLFVLHQAVAGLA